MALPPLYAGRQDPPRAMPLPQVDPRSTGAAIADGIAALGGAGTRFVQAEYDGEAAQQSADFGLRSAQAREAIDEEIAALDPAAPDHDQKVGAIVDGWRDKTFAGVTNGRAQRDAIPLWANYAGNVRARADLTGRTARADKAVDAIEQARRIGIARRRRGAGDYATELAGLVAMTDAQPDLTATLRNRINQEHADQLSLAEAEYLTERDPAALLTSLDTGAWDERLDPKAMEAVRKTAAYRLTTMKTQADAAAKADVETDTAALSVAIAEMKQGDPAPDKWDATAVSLDGLAARAEAVGKIERAGELRRQAVDARGAAAVKRAAAGYRGATPQERDARIASLRAKPELTTREGNELRGLQEQARTVSPLTALGRAAFAENRGVEPIDWADDASIDRRIARTAGAVAQYGGVAAPLEPQDVAQLKQMIERGDADQRIVAAHAIARFGQFGRQALDQVAGNDASFRAAVPLVTLPNGEALMRAALKGPEALAAHKGLLTPEKQEDGASPLPGPDTLFDGALSLASAGLDPAAVAALRLNVRNIYLSNAAAKGAANFDATEYRRAVNLALGGRLTGGGWVGGVGQWAGRNVILPREMAQSSFDVRVSGMTDFELKAGGSEPLYSDGRPIPADVVKRMTPVMVRDGVYKWRFPQGGFAMTRGQTPFVLDVRRLPETRISAGGRGAPVLPRLSAH